MHCVCKYKHINAGLFQLYIYCPQNVVDMGSILRLKHTHKCDGPGKILNPYFSKQLVTLRNLLVKLRAICERALSCIKWKF